MKKEIVAINSVNDYIATYPPAVRKLLTQMRKTIKAAAPEAEEIISYHMPAYKQHGILVYFAAHTNHIGFYPFRSAIDEFSQELKNYEGSKGTVRFPFTEPIPVRLVTRMVKFRVKRNIEKMKAKKSLTRKS